MLYMCGNNNKESLSSLRQVVRVIKRVDLHGLYVNILRVAHEMRGVPLFAGVPESPTYRA